MGQGSKNSRVLEIYQMLLDGKTVSRAELAKQCNVDIRSIQRDIDTIRNFLSEDFFQHGTVRSVKYDRISGGYRLISEDAEYLSEGELLAICKILIESRAFSKEKLLSIVKKVMSLTILPKSKARVEEQIANELFNFISPTHADPNPDFLWTAAQAIQEQRVVELTYTRMRKGKTVTRRVAPVGIIFSEYYFYLMCFIDDPELSKYFEKAEDPFPTIYRIDRVQKFEVTEDRYVLPYKDRFQEGPYKNLNQFMFGGELQHVEFKYLGPSIEAVMDRFPTATVRTEEDGSYSVSAEVFGKGVLMWLLSQGSNVSVSAPQQLRDSWLKEISVIHARES